MTADETFEREFLPHLDSVYRFARSLAGDGTQAEDLAQEAFLRAFRARKRYKQGTNAKAYLFTIVKNLWRERGRKKMEETSLEDLAGPLASWEDIGDPEQALLQEESWAEVEKMFDQVPGDFRAILLLVDVEGLSYEEAASLTKLPVGTVKSRLARGRNHLKRAWLERRKRQ